jgi:DNA polymerase
MGLQENELKPLVDSWRAANRQITRLWWAVDQAARLCIKTKFTQELRSGIRMRMEGMFLRIGLPSGRELSYAKPRIDEEDRITFEGMIQNGGWGRQDTYGPKLVENIVQAVSRDCLAVSMRRLEEMGVPIVFHVHDEVICEVPEASTIFYADGMQYYEDPTWTAAEIADVMGQPIEWAPGLPLRADAYECEYYRKD